MRFDDAISQLLSEVTGKPVEKTRELVVALFPPEKLSEEITDAQLNELRSEKAGILNWCIDGLRRIR